MTPALVPGLERVDEFVVEDRLVTDVGGTIGVSVLSTPGRIRGDGTLRYSMGYRSEQASKIWALVGTTHGVVGRAQLLALGMSAQAIKRRRASGRLHNVRPGIYVVGRPELSRPGRSWRRCSPAGRRRR